MEAKINMSNDIREPLPTFTIKAFGASETFSFVEYIGFEKAFPDGQEEWKKKYKNDVLHAIDDGTFLRTIGESLDRLWQQSVSKTE